jgi:hypothetical protein
MAAALLGAGGGGTAAAALEAAQRCAHLPPDQQLDMLGQQAAPCNNRSKPPFNTFANPRVLNSVSGLVSITWYRILFDQSELSISEIPPTDSPKVRPGRHP